MNAIELLDHLESKDVELWEENGNIRFRAARNVMDDGLLNALAGNKAEILTLLKGRDVGETGVAFRPIADLENRYAPFPLTDVQQAYWIGRSNVYQLGDVSCHIYIEMDCPDLDTPRLNRAWHKIVRRHDMLRAVIRPDGKQVILAQVPDYQITTVNMADAGHDNVEAELHNIREEMSHQVLPADTWPLFDIRAVRCPGNKTRLHLTFEYLVADAWSIDLFVREWVQTYHDSGHELPPLEFSFRDYVLHEERLKNSEEYKSGLAYWKKRVATLPSGPDLPLAMPPHELEETRFTRLSSKLDKPLWQALKEMGKQQKVTPSAILLTAFSEVLGTWSKTPRFCINLTLFNRLPIHPQVNDIVGDFTSLTMLEVDTSQPGSFAHQAERLQKQLWDDMEHRSVSGVRVLRELARERKESEQIFMPVVFTSVLGYDTLDEAGASAHAPLGEVIYNITQTPQVWIDHQVTESDGTLNFNWDVVEDIFPKGMVREMFDAYCQYLEQLVKRELFSKPVPPLIPERHLAVRKEINRTGVSRPEATLHSLFLDTAGATPDRPAVISGGRTLTYGELDAASNRLAAFLTDKGMKKGNLVAVVMEKGWEQVAAVLGILKAGAAYLPLSPGLPRERLFHILEHGNVGLAIIRQEGDGVNSWPEGVDVVAIDAPEIEGLSPDFSGVTSAPEDLAYVIYTSGSTGLPKGVVIDHRGAVNTILDINTRFDIQPDDRILGLSSLTFDLSVYDVFGTLAAGATLVIPEAEGIRDPSYLADLMKGQGITVWNSVPTLMEMLTDYVSAAPETDISSIRLAMLSGSWIPLKLPDKVWALAPRAKVISLGGATEASIWSVIHPIETLDPSWESIPYGRPMENQALHVLDAEFKDRPDWVTGQIYISGQGLAKGYFNDPQKTATAFITRPETGENLYRTGDLGRYRPDGTIELLGREDNQVKIRGYRVELGEIEAALRSHPGVKEAVVTAVGGVRENRQLVGFVQEIPEQADTLYDISAVDPGETARRLESLVKAARCKASEASVDEELEYAKVFMARFEELAFQYICRNFMEMALFAGPDDCLSIEELVRRGNLEPEYEQLFRKQMNLLVEKGVLNNEDGMISQTLFPIYDTNKIEDMWAEVDGIIEQSPADQKEKMRTWLSCSYLRSCGEKGMEMFRGQVDPLDIFFPDGAKDWTENIYQMNLVGRHYNGIYAGMMEEIARNRNSDTPLRILEVGAGAGSASSSVLPVLDPENTVYHYTDVSTFFTNEAKVTFKEFAFVDYGILDINQDPVLQGYTPESFDVIIASSVLNLAHDMETTIRYIHSLLVPGGQALIFEPVKETNQMLMTLSFIPGLSNFEDEYRIENNSAFLPKDKWQEVLLGNGFMRLEYVGAPDSSFDIFGVQMMVAQAATRKRHFKRAVLTDHLSRKLPDYMIPSAFLPVEDFPLNATGKLDRKALTRNLGDLGQERSKNYTAPRNPLEKQIAEIWEDLLDMEHVGINDNFFDLGGDSLLVSQMLAKLRESIDTDIEWDTVIRNLIESPTIAEMVETIYGQSASAEADSPVVRLKGQGSLSPFFCIHDGTGNLSAYARLPNVIHRERPIHAFKITDAEAYTSIERGQLVTKVAANYLDRIKSIQPEGPYVFGGFCMGGVFGWEIAQQMKQNGDEVKALVLISSTHPSFMIDDDTMILELFSWTYRFSLSNGGLDLETENRISGFMDLLSRQNPGDIDAAFVDRLFAENFKYEKMDTDQLFQEAFEIACRQSRAFGDDANLEKFLALYKIFKHSTLSLPRYDIQPYDGEVHLFRPKDAEYLSGYGKQDTAEYFGKLAVNGLKVHEVPGKHFSCMEEPNLGILASKLNTILS